MQPAHLSTCFAIQVFCARCRLLKPLVSLHIKGFAPLHGGLWVRTLLHMDPGVFQVTETGNNDFIHQGIRLGLPKALEVQGKGARQEEWISASATFLQPPPAALNELLKVFGF